MSRHTVEISDEAGQSFRILVDLAVWPCIATGSWRSIDKGFLRYNSGKARYVYAGYDPDQHHLALCLSQGEGYGLRCNDYLGDWSYINDEGVGIVAQPWVISLKPGRISWVLADD